MRVATVGRDNVIIIPCYPQRVLPKPTLFLLRKGKENMSKFLNIFVKISVNASLHGEVGRETFNPW